MATIQEAYEAGTPSPLAPPGRGWLSRSERRVRGLARDMTREPIRRARVLRLNETNAEMRLWSDLRDRRLNGYKFVRQFPVAQFIADFACRSHGLVVELDGGQHGQDREQARDASRTAVLNQAGFSVLRFWNDEVLRERRAVLETILAVLDGGVTDPSPCLRFAPATLSPEGRGGRGGAVEFVLETDKSLEG